MQIQIGSRMPAARAGQLVALIDLGAERSLYLDRTAKDYPGWSDLRRRRRGEPIKSAYLATGEAPLLYLPADAAKYWEGDEKIRVLAAKAYDAACKRSAGTLIVLLDGPAGAEAATVVAEGIALRAYRFDKYKKSVAEQKSPAVKFVCTAEGLRELRVAVADRLERIASVNRARDLVNEPGSVATPAEIEARARAMAKETGLRIQVLGVKALENEGYQGLLTVGKAGGVPPRMVILRHRPKGLAEDAPHLGLLGKGITFDTGGISIKPSNKMWEMKGDMGGAAAVLYAMESIAREQVPMTVTGILCLAHNMIDRNAVLPGDIFTAKNGKTIHVDNTDAEGRLVLTDGMWKMGEEGATHMADIATLTGACQRALGPALTGIFGKDEWVKLFSDVAAGQGEPCWQLPMVEEYAEWLKFEIADINNIASKPYAGASTAALFLREFVPEGVKHWCHLDIAGTFLMESDHKYFRTGATGVMVRTFLALAQRLAME